MDNVVTLFEYESIKFEKGEKDQYDGNKLILTERTIKELEKFSEKKIIELKWKKIKALNYVGVTKAGDIVIEILPKFLKRDNRERYREYENEELKEIAVKNLLKMLEYTRKLKFKEIDYASLEKVEHSFFEILIHLFAKNLLLLLKVKQNYEYVRKREELRFVRGRIDFARLNPTRLHVIPCVHFRRSMDNLINRTLKYACYLLLRITRSHENRVMLRRIVDLLDDVTLTPVTVQEIERITFNRLNADFKPFIDLCRLIIEGSTLTLQASKIETFSLMIPMETLFEEFVAEVIRRHQLYEVFGEKAKLLTQHSIGHLAERDGKRLFRMFPDMVVKVGNEIKLIIDTKYKLLEPEDAKLGVTQQDLYQIYAYCKYTGASKALLLYPDNLVNVEKPEFKLGRSGEIKLLVKTVPLCLDLTREFKKFVESVREILEEAKVY